MQSQGTAGAPAAAAVDRTRRRRWAVGCGASLLVVVVGLGVAWLVADEPVPKGEQGAGADALAREVEGAIDRGAWERTRAVRWTFRGSRHHLWDRERELSRVTWDDVVVLHRIGAGTGQGLAWVGGEPVGEDERPALVRKAHEAFINDAFWLNPLVKFFDRGVTRSQVALDDGARGLLMHFASGGVTPGDSYLWEVGPDGLPTAVQMWVSILPVGGTRFTWERYLTLATGARVATFHKSGPLELELTDVAGAASLAELVPGDDPFAPLLAVAPSATP